MDAWIRQQIGSFATQPCRVLDVSRTGVRLEVGNADKVPTSFILLFSKADAGHNVTVKWRRGAQIGAEFSSADPPQPRAFWQETNSRESSKAV
jgi:hypothetical protein